MLHLGYIYFLSKFLDFIDTFCFIARKKFDHIRCVSQSAQKYLIQNIVWTGVLRPFIAVFSMCSTTASCLCHSGLEPAGSAGAMHPSQPCSTHLSTPSCTPTTWLQPWDLSTRYGAEGTEAHYPWQDIKCRLAIRLPDFGDWWHLHSS